MDIVVWLTVGFVLLVATAIVGSYRRKAAFLASRLPCPACKEPIQRAALICPHCRLNLAHGEGRRAMDATLRQATTDHEAAVRSRRFYATILLAMIAATSAYIWLRLSTS